MIILDPGHATDVPIAEVPPVAVHSKKTLRILGDDRAILISA
jgi:hypothetical protein